MEKNLDETLKTWEAGRKRSVAMVLEPHMRELMREAWKKALRQEENMEVSSDEEEEFKTSDKQIDREEEEHDDEEEWEIK